MIHWQSMTCGEPPVLAINFYRNTVTPMSLNIFVATHTLQSESEAAQSLSRIQLFATV